MWSLASSVIVAGTQVDGLVKLHFLMFHISYGEVPIVVHIPHKARQ